MEAIGCEARQTPCRPPIFSPRLTCSPCLPAALPPIPPASPQPYGLNDTIGCLLDRGEGAAEHTITFTKNGTPLGVAFTLPQVWTGTAPPWVPLRLACLPWGALLRFAAWVVLRWTHGPMGCCPCVAISTPPPPRPSRRRHPLALQSLKGQALYPAVCLKNAELQLNFGGSPFKHPPPPGFVGLAAAPAELVADWQVPGSNGDGAAAAAADGKPLAIILEPARWVA